MKTGFQQKDQTHRGDLPVPFSALCVGGFGKPASVDVLKCFILLKQLDGLAQMFDIRGEIDIHIADQRALIEGDTFSEGDAHPSLAHPHIGDFRIFFGEPFSDFGRLILGAVVQDRDFGRNVQVLSDITDGFIDTLFKPQPFV